MNFHSETAIRSYENLLWSLSFVSFLPRIKYGINSSRNPDVVKMTGFPFSRLRAEALRRASTGMTILTDTGHGHGYINL